VGIGDVERYRAGREVDDPRTAIGEWSAIGLLRSEIIPILTGAPVAWSTGPSTSAAAVVPPVEGLSSSEPLLPQAVRSRRAAVATDKPDKTDKRLPGTRRRARPPADASAGIPLLAM
jgi:hypothetical protein